MSSEAKNLEAISRAIDQHNSNCPFPASEVRMNPFEVERLGWEEIRGLPIVADPAISTGRFRIVCSREGSGKELEEVEAIGEPIEVGERGLSGTGVRPHKRQAIGQALTVLGSDPFAGQTPVPVPVRDPNRAPESGSAPRC